MHLSYHLSFGGRREESQPKRRNGFRKHAIQSWLFGSAWLLLALTGCGSGPGTPDSRGGASSSAGKRPAATAATTALASTNTNSVASIPRSVFQSDLQSGRDPFFPGASRAPAQAAGTTAAQRLPTLSYLKLLGIRPGTTRPMALINKTSLAPGEEGNVSIVFTNELSKAEVQKINVRCLEIRRDSVLISIAGEGGVKELRIAQGK